MLIQHMKHWLATVAVLLGYINASAATVISGTCGDDLFYALDDNGELVIQGTGEMYDYGYDEYSENGVAPWSEYKDMLNMIIVFEGVTSIGDDAFYDCSSLTSVALPESMTKIGDSAFSGCNSLASISFPESMTEIGSSAFSGCRSLTTVNIPRGVASIESGAFEGCHNLVSAIISEGVVSIESSAFYGCSSLLYVSIPSTVRTISESDVFRFCYKLARIEIDDYNTVYSDGGESNFVIEISSRKLLYGCKDGIIPSYITEIGHSAFIGRDNLTTLHIPESVVSINTGSYNQNPFACCRNLKSITVSENNPYYYDGGCNALIARTNGDHNNVILAASSSTIIPEEVEFILWSAYCNFNDWSSATSRAITPPTYTLGTFIYINDEGSASFGAEAEWLPDITLYVPAASVDEYRTTGLWGLFNVQPIIIASGTCGDNLTWKLTEEYELIIEGSGPMTDYTTGTPGVFVTSVPWADYKGLITSVVIGNGVTTIGNSAFESCSNLTSIILPESLTRIGNYAFDLCSSLTHIFIPKNVTDIGFQSLSSCIGLTSLVVDEDNPMYDSRGGCNAVIETGSNKLVRGCSVTVIPEDVAVIGDRSFSGCSSLTSIVIPESVVEIETYAFEECTGLTSITCEAMTPPTATNVTFMNVDRSIPVYVPASSVSAYQSARYWSEFANIQPIDTPIVEEPITSSDQLSNTKLYYVSQPHHSKGLTSWAVAEDGSELKSNVDLGITADSGDSRQQFAFIYRDGVYYLYHAAEKKFVNANGSLSSTPVSPIYFGVGAYDNTFVLYFDDTHYINVGGSREMLVNSWKTLDGGNSCSIVPVGEFDPSEALDKETTLLSYTKIGAGEAELTFADVSLTEVVIPETVVIDGEICRVTSIGNKVFEGNSNLISVTIPEGVTILGDYAFRYCSSLESLNLPNNLLRIELAAMSRCGSLTSIIIPNSVTAIGAYAFDYTGLESVVLGEGVENIGNNAFQGCSSLTSITSNAVIPPTIEGSYAFDGVDKSIPVYVPASSVSAYQSASYWSDFTNIQPVIEIGDTSDWTSSNQGQAGSVSSKTYILEVGAGDILTFDWMVSSEGNYDKLVVALDGTEVLNESGEQSGTFEKVFVASGTCTLVVRYSKDGSEDRGSDCAKVYNMRLVSADWFSDNHENNSVSSETYTFATIPGGVLSFDWKVSSESNYDYFIATLNGEEVLRKSGEASGTYQYTFTSLGTNTLVLKYTKDGSQSNGSDLAMVYNLTFPATRDVILSDSDASFVQNEDEGCTSITYTRNFKNTNWQALYVPFEIPVTEEFLADYEVAYIYDARQYDHDDDGVKDETLIECFKVKNGTLEANYPYLIRAKVAGVKNIVVTNTTLYATEENSVDCSSVFDTYTFTGTYSRMSSDLLPQDGGYYALSGGSWSPVKEGTSLGAFRFYLKIDSRNGNSNNVANARSIRMRFVGDDEDEETTGIDDSQITIDNSQAIYDLQGRRVDNPTMGVYIVNGKKVILK